MTQPNEALKPCPFCGGDAVCSPCDDSGEIAFGVSCMSCLAQITKADEAAAIEQWNTRASVLVMIEQLAPFIHGAMVYAVNHFKGEPQPWQNGNSHAEHHARCVASEAIAAWNTRTRTPEIPASDVVEKVARAIYESAQAENGNHSALPWHIVRDGETAARWFAYARAAIAAMTEPPKGQGE